MESRRRRILVVEDDEDLCIILGTAVRSLGVDTTVVSSGRAVLAALAEQIPDLLLLDVMLPDVSGFELLQQLRQIPAYVAVPVIFLSARSREAEVKNGLALGACAYLVKPFSIEDFLSTIRRHLPA
ncbi:MAG: response regulator [Planctomycetes bacterium]|nr:response regulator [Planctomycetota bacterium]